MKIFVALFFLALLSISCATGDGYSDICKSSRMTYNLYSYSEEYTESYSFTINLQNEISELSKYGNLNFDISSSEISNESGNLNWIKSITVEMVSADNPDKFPRILFSKFEPFLSNQNKIILTPVVDSGTLTRYLKNGDTVFIVSISGKIPDRAQLDNEMCFHTHINVEKDIF